MISRLLTNIVLLVFVAGLGSYIYVTRNDGVVSHNLTKLDPETISKISIWHNGRDIELRKNNKHWQMLKPTNIEANDFRVRALLKILTTDSLGSYDPANLKLSEYGLDKPKTWMRLGKLKIEFGVDNPINHNRYVLVNNRVHLISDQFYPLISSQVGTLVSPNLLPRGAVITGIKLPDQTLSEDKIGWTSTDKKITTDAIQKTVDAWNNAQAFGVHTYERLKSKGKIEVYIKSRKKPLVFEISTLHPWMILARPADNVEYHFDTAYIDRLLHPGAKKKKPKKAEKNSAAATKPSSRTASAAH